jgi:hypothetical protein
LRFTQIEHWRGIWSIFASKSPALLEFACFAFFDAACP